jgi:hypothetical protein
VVAASQENTKPRKNPAMKRTVGEDKYKRATSTWGIENAAIYQCISPEGIIRRSKEHFAFSTPVDPISGNPKSEGDKSYLVSPSEQRIQERAQTRAKSHPGCYRSEHAPHWPTLHHIGIEIPNDAQCNGRNSSGTGR